MKKTNKKKIDILLEKIVKENLSILKEDDYGGDGYDSYSDYDSYGGGGGYGSSAAQSGLYKIFVQPLVDVGMSALNVFSTLSTSAQEVLKTLIINIPKAIIPWLKTEDYKVIQHRQTVAIASLNSKYAETLKNNMEALKDHDLWGFYFLLDPTRMLGTKAAYEIPGLATTVLEITGFGPALHYAKNVVGKNHGELSSYYTNDSVQRLHQGMIFEQPQEGTQENLQIRQILNSKEAQDKISNNSEILQVRRAVLNDLVEHINEVLQQESYEEIVKLSQFNRIKTDLNKGFKFGKIKREDIDGTKKVVVDEFKKTYRKYYIDMLEQLKKEIPKASKDIEACIKQIIQ
jgi:hypothetical protein